MSIKFPVLLQEFYVVLIRETCFGNCPNYYLKVNGSGKVEYLGIENVQHKGRHTKTISQSKILLLFQQIFELGILELDSVYKEIKYYEIINDSIDCSSETLTDQPSIKLEIRIGKYVKKIHDYYGAPERLKQFEKLIDNTCAIQKWIGKGVDN